MNSALYILYLFLFPATHEFKMSVTEIGYSTEKEAVVVKVFLFQDDLKETLYGDPEAPFLEPDSISSYVSKNLQFLAGGQIQNMVFQTTKEKEDQILVEFILPHFIMSNSSNLIVKNQLLIEQFEKQANMVFLDLPDRSRISLIFDASKTEGEFKW